MSPIELVVPEASAVAAGGGTALVWLQAAMLVAAALAAGAFFAVRLLRPVPESVALRRAFGRVARGMKLDPSDRETILAMGAASQIEPSALLLSDRALRMARVASLAAVSESGPMSSARIKSACAKLGVE